MHQDDSNMYGTLRRQNSEPMIFSSSTSGTKKNRTLSGGSETELAAHQSGVEKKSGSNVGSLRRSKSMASLRQSIRLSSMKYDFTEMEKEPIKSVSRRQTFRHIVGLRTYAQIPTVVRRIEAICSNVKALITWPKLGVEFTLSQINDYLNELQSTQSKYYNLSDKLIEYQELCREIDYLKKNLEACVRSSISTAQRRVNSLRSPNKTQAELPISDVSTQTWCDHNELRGIVCDLTDMLNESSNDNDLSLSKEILQRTINKARSDTRIILQKSPMRAMFDAKQDLALLNELRAKLESIETRLSQNLQRHQVVAGVMLTVCRRAKMTIKLLNARIKLFESTMIQQKTRDVAAERIGLLDFIESARTYDREQQEAKRKEREKTCPSENPFFLSSPKRMNNELLSDEKPVWAVTWSPATKILRKK